MNADFMLQQN